ncbi:MAG TPA: homoserine kinase [Rhizomicrobium sp.]|nr:homoserine kinase [Rhizomicrobium sp.]
MAVYTDVSFEDLEKLLTDYDIGSPRSFKGIAEGVENSNFHLQTNRGGYILTLYEKRVRESDLPFFLDLMEHLAAHGIACPQPVRNKNGENWIRLNGKPAALLTFLDGVSLRKPEVTHCALAGEALAKLHEAGRDFKNVRENSLSVDGWKKLANDTLPKADVVQKGLASLIETTLSEFTDWPSGLPGGVIHADLFPDNVLFVDGKISGLIDFYFACNDAFAYDIAVMLNAWCFEQDGTFNITKGRNFLAAYRRQRALTQGEIEALPVLARGAALRFLLTRLYDWINPDPTALVRPKDPKDFAKRLRFHRNVRSAAEYGL